MALTGGGCYVLPVLMYEPGKDYSIYLFRITVRSDRRQLSRSVPRAMQKNTFERCVYACYLLLLVEREAPE